MEIKLGLAFLDNEEFKDVPQATKDLISTALQHQCVLISEHYKDEIEKQLQEKMGTAAQHIAAIETIALKTLHKQKAKRLICQYSGEVYDSRKKKEDTIQRDQESLLRAMVAEEVRKHTAINSATEEDEPTDYHTLKEIRYIIFTNKELIHKYFEGRSFSRSAFIDHIRTYTTLRSGDLAKNTDGHEPWTKRVWSAISSSKPKGYAVKKVAANRYVFELSEVA